MNTTLKYYSLFVIAALISFGSQAQTYDAGYKLQKAEDLYNAQKYDSAALIYHQFLEEDLSSFELYYNLGNTYFKLNEIPSAILYYEKAAKLKPQDKDLQYNLTLCNRLIPDKIEEVPQLFFVKWYQSLYNSLSVDYWAYISLVIFMIGLLCIAVFFMSAQLRWRRLSFTFSLLLIVLTVGSLTIAHQKYRNFIAHNQAIVFNPSLTVKSQPADNSIDIFVIHEGTKVLLLDEVGDWRKIKIKNGSIGWVLAENLELI